MNIFQCMMADIAKVVSFVPEAAKTGIAYGIVILVLCLAAGKLQYRQKKKQPEGMNMDGETETVCRWWPLRSGQWLGSILFVIYFLVLLQTVFFSREPGSRWGTQLQFLGTWGTTMQDHAWVLENILLFLPFGILLPVCLPGRGHWLTVPAGILCSACIEYIQLRTGRGYCQLDDVVMNGLGALAGWLIWWLIRLFCMGVRLFWHQTFIRKRVFLVVAVLWMVVIFLFSSQPADESTQTSLRVERVICALMIPDYNMKTPEEQTALAERIEFPVRKGAHMTEYAILAVLLLGTLAGEYMEGSIVIWSVILAALYASTDEFHQLFVPGRSGQFRDVLIDSCGAAAGTLIVYALWWRGSRGHRK